MPGLSCKLQASRHKCWILSYLSPPVTLHTNSPWILDDVLLLMPLFILFSDEALGRASVECFIKKFIWSAKTSLFEQAHCLLCSCITSLEHYASSYRTGVDGLFPKALSWKWKRAIKIINSSCTILFLSSLHVDWPPASLASEQKC